MEKIECKHCGKKFDSSRSLEQHVAAKHSATYQPAKVVKKKFTFKSLILYAVISAIAGIAIYGIVWAITSPASQIGTVGSTHIHADIAVFLDGKQITPFGHQYFVRASYAHVESGPGEGTVIHMHATGVPLGGFFSSLGMKFDQKCFVTDSRASYCNSASKTLKMFVKHGGGEWQQNFDYDKYVFVDLDKILITYGDETEEELGIQKSAVTDFSKDNSGRQMPVR